MGAISGQSGKIYWTGLQGSLIGGERQMKLLCYLALVFIDAFGITHPSVEARDRAAKYIAFLMVGLFLTLCSVFFVALRILRP